MIHGATRPRGFAQDQTTDGAYLVQPDPTEAGRNRLLGVPVYPTTAIPTNGGVSADESRVILADMAQVAVGRDEDVTVTVLEERFADFDQIGLRMTARFDVEALNPQAVVVLSGVTE